MKAFLLVAGLGTRLRPLTDTVPKCLLPVRGVPLLELWLRRLEKLGVREVLVNTHWLHGEVEKFLAARPKGAMRVISFHEPELLGSGGTLLANRDFVADDEPFFIIYGDNLTDADLAGMAKSHRSHGLPFTLGVFRAEHPERCGIAVADPSGLVTAFEEKPEQPRSDLAAAGIYVADRRLFGFFPEPGSLKKGEVLDLGFHILPRLCYNMRIFPISTVLDIGTPAAYEMAQRLGSEGFGAVQE